MIYLEKRRLYAHLDKEALKLGCIKCGSSIEKIQYLGGASYFCPKCQAL